MKAIITAAGKGTRLYPITRAYPKELITFCGKPVLEYCINLLQESRITNIIIVIGQEKKSIIDYFGNGSIFNTNISYAIQEYPNGLGDAILKAEHFIDDDFVLLLGDTIIIDHIDLNEMIKIHQKNKASATILVEIVENPERFGVVKIDKTLENRIISVYEKPTEKKIKEEFKTIDEFGSPGWYSIAGLYIFDKNIFSYLRNTSIGHNNEIQLTDAIKLAIDNGNIVLGHVLKGKRIDIGTWEYLKEERDFYSKMSDDELDKIIESRYDKL
jgi:dTDP-glucose pyrophosphorylase